MASLQKALACQGACQYMQKMKKNWVVCGRATTKMTWGLYFLGLGAKQVPEEGRVATKFSK